MGNINRWLGYAKAKIEMAVSSGNRELDELEAEREAETADKPWLRSEGEAPTFDEARARIEWEAEQAAKGAEGASRHPPVDTEAVTSDPSSKPPSAPLTSPEERAQQADEASARLELEARQRESAARLDAIRAELGIEPEEPA